MAQRGSIPKTEAGDAYTMYIDIVLQQAVHDEFRVLGTLVARGHSLGSAFPLVR